MNVMVTGAGGMAGRSISKGLYAAGYNVVGMIRKTPGIAEIKTVFCDLSKPIELDETPEVIIHTAGALPYRNSSAIQYKRDNVDAMENLIAFSRRVGVKRIINYSTIGVYGEFREEEIDEESDRINPDMYGQTKFIAEQMLAESEDIENISLRMPGILGPGARGIWVTHAIEKLKKGESLSIYSPDFVTTNFVDVYTLNSFVLKLLESKKWGEKRIVLACEEGKSIKEITDYMLKKCDSKSEIRVEKTRKKPFRLNAEKAFKMGYRGEDPIHIIKRYLERYNG